ncbi:MAG: cobyrinate a,c-diamide synthase, partial [Desulfurella sp.]
MKEISAPRIYISAFKKSSGKTTISIALSKILSRKYKLLTFKKGPDYI